MTKPIALVRVPNYFGHEQLDLFSKRLADEWRESYHVLIVLEPIERLALEVYNPGDLMTEEEVENLRAKLNELLKAPQAER
jgi:hypothetical protein